MVSFIQQLINLLLIPPGNFIYHLVLAFSIAGVLPAALSQRREVDLKWGKRLLLGLILLLIGRLLLFLAAALALQGILEEHLFLPPIDRAVTLVSLIVVIWLWCFPKPHRLADILAVACGIMVFIASAFNLLLWLNLGSSNISFNAFLGNTVSDVLALTFLLIGSLLAIVRRPSGWGIGLAMFIILAIGHVLSFIYPSFETDYSGAIRLTQMIAFPLLFTIPHRFASETPSLPLQSLPMQDEEHRRFGINPDLLQSLLDLGMETDMEKFCRAMTHSVAHIMLADLCYLASPPEQSGEIIFECGYDLIREEYLLGFAIEARKMPLLSDAMSNNQAVQIDSKSSSREMKSLARILNLSNVGRLLAAPLTNQDGEVTCMLVLLTPYSNRDWVGEDQSKLVSIANSMAHILQRYLSQERYPDEIRGLQENLQVAESERDAAQKEIARLSSQIETSESTSDEGITLSEEKETEYLQTIAGLQAVIDQLQEKKTLQETPQQGNTFMQEILVMNGKERNSEQLAGELNLALEEIARLSHTLSEMEQADSEVLSQKYSLYASGSKSEVFTGISQELSSPLSSVIGYTDFLLAESFGSLGPIQRKFVERIKFSCDRMNRILEISPEIDKSLAERLQLKLTAVDLNSILESLTERLHIQMLEKQISFDKIIEEKLLPIEADWDALEQILSSVLEHAIAVTPEEGTVAFRAMMHTTESERDMVLIQISDQGGGVIAKPQNGVFVSQPQSEEIPLESEGIDSGMLKDLVVMQNGSIWLESEEGIGSTINILMPLFIDQPPTDQEGGIEA